MKILVLGNGFDLDHNLPTSYKNFLNFCLYITQVSSTAKRFYNELTTTQKKYVKQLEQRKNLKKKFVSLLENNHLLKYFLFRFEQQGKDWIDLEREIESIVHEFEAIEEEYIRSKVNYYTADTEHRIHETIDKLGLNEIAQEKISEVTLNKIHDSLQNSLRDFCKALELYIVHFINTTHISGIAPDIISFDATDIITFNYSNTYQRVYSGVHWRENVDHVHGIASINEGEESNIVLGITDSVESTASNRYVDFRKYFQRITKKTEDTYKKWMRIKSANKGVIEVVFFGHSLASSDSDIIKDLICHENTKILIYYYNDIAHQNIVANLIEILNKSKLIEYTSGENPKISFRLQQSHQHNNTAGVEIERDVRKLYKLYSLKSKDINKLIEKIKNRINQKKLSYFYSQRKTIDLFEALKWANIYNFNVKTFYNICVSLDFEVSKDGNLVKYHYDEWQGETPWGDIIECNKSTKSLIDKVNNSNSIRFHEMESNKPYAYFHTLTTVEEIKDALLDIFKKEPSDIYWKNLNNLMDEMVESNLFENAIDILYREEYPIQIYSKIKHFYWAYKETVYNFHMRIAWEEEQKNNQSPYDDE